MKTKRIHLFTDEEFFLITYSLRRLVDSTAYATTKDEAADLIRKLSGELPAGTFTVQSSEGTLIVSANDGRVIEAQPYPDCDLSTIQGFNVNEWEGRNKKRITGLDIDILDLGVFTTKGQYDPPVDLTSHQ